MLLTEKQFMAVWEKTELSLQNFIFRLSLNKREDAKDLLQEVFILCFKNRNKFNSEKSCFKTWTYSIAKNLFIDEYRKKKIRININGSDNNLLSNDDEMPVKDPTSYNMGHENLIENDVQSVFSKLDPKFLTPFLMMVEGFKYDDIAKELKLPVGTVKNRIFRAKKELQGYLKSYNLASVDDNIFL
jgi:RNA polymerase sigma factor (sigma-70 family)